MAITKIARVGESHCTIGEFRSRIGEDSIPPLEEFGWIAFWRDRIIASAVASRY